MGGPRPVSGSPEDKKRLTLPWVALVWNMGFSPYLWTQTERSALPGCQALRLGTRNTPLSLLGLQLASCWCWDLSAYVYIFCSLHVSGQPYYIELPRNASSSQAPQGALPESSRLELPHLMLPVLLDMADHLYSAICSFIHHLFNFIISCPISDAYMQLSSVDIHLNFLHNFQDQHIQN